MTSLLHYAAATGDLETVARALSAAPTAARESDYDGRTPLHVAATNARLEIIDLLCSHGGADVNAKDRWGRTPLQESLLRRNGETARYLRAQGAGRVREEEEEVEVFESAQAQMRQHMDPESGEAQLFQAACFGDANRVRKLVLNRRVFSVNLVDDYKRTPAHVAACEGKLSVLQVLKEFGADFNVRDAYGNSPLDDALRWGRDPVARFLRESGGVSYAATPTPKRGPARAGMMTSLPSFSESDPKRFPEEAFSVLHKRGCREHWSWSSRDFAVDSAPFAKGSGGEVFHARFRDMRIVAKTTSELFSNANLADLGNEISLLASIRHPHIVMFFGACFQVSPPVLLMEHCAGGNLETRLLRCHEVGLTSDQKVRYAHEISLGLSFLHNFHVPIMHRDMKPSNVLLTADDHCKLTDFGLAKKHQAVLLHEEPQPQSSPQPQHDAPPARSPPTTPSSKHRARKGGGSMLGLVNLLSLSPSPGLEEAAAEELTGETGSYRFMAPEVFRHERYDHKVDIYSYALVLYWLFSGVRPFAERDPIEAARFAALSDGRPDLALVRETRIQDLLVKCWDRDPTKRPSTTDVNRVWDDVEASGLGESGGGSSGTPRKAWFLKNLTAFFRRKSTDKLSTDLRRGDSMDAATSEEE